MLAGCREMRVTLCLASPTDRQPSRNGKSRNCEPAWRDTRVAIGGSHTNNRGFMMGAPILRSFLLANRGSPSALVASRFPRVREILRHRSAHALLPDDIRACHTHHGKYYERDKSFRTEPVLLCLRPLSILASMFARLAFPSLARFERGYELRGNFQPEEYLGSSSPFRGFNLERHKASVRAARVFDSCASRRRLLLPSETSAQSEKDVVPD